MGEFVADLTDQADVLHRTGEVPIGAPLVAGLVIALPGIGIDPRLPGLDAALLEVGRSGNSHHEQHRHAALGEGEMVGAVEQPAFGQAFWRDAAALRRRDARHIVFERILPLADQHHVVAGPRGLEDIDREVGDGRFEREDGVGGVIFGPEQPALLGGPGGEHDAAIGRRTRLDRPGDLEQRGDAERIVVGAGAINAALRIGRTLAVRIPVRAEHHAFLRALRAGDPREHVVAVDPFVGDGDARIERHAGQRHRSETRGSGGDFERGEIEPCCGEERAGGIAGDPALQA